ncbi:MAG: MraY family glycosyltransferase [Desulfobacterales bacterium]|jgi:UDP-GlcNAc:undecaprenyl-phosphate GlcNAc-1-phosphate transferase
MVEIVKDETADNFVNSAVLPAQSTAGQPCVELIVDRDETADKAGLVEILSRSLHVNFFVYAAVAALTCVLLVPQVRGYILQIGLRWVHILCLSFALSFCLNPIFAGIARKLKILDMPDARKLHSEATPLLGGAAVFIGFGVALLMNGIFSTQVLMILLTSLILFGVGIIDDFKEISAGLKLAAQMLCTLLVMSCGIVLRVLPVDLGILATIGNVLLTVFWIIGITNAMNFFDGMDGLAAGLGALISFFLCVVAFQTAQHFLGWIAVAMLGACLGFLPFNFRPKKNAAIFLGDAGSVVIGFILACLAVYGDWAQSDPVVALVSPVLIFWILIFDMVHITIDRILTGKVKNFKQWIDYVGKDHLHHRLAHVLGGRKQSVLFIYLLGLCLGTSAVVLRNARPADALLLIIQACIMVVLITVLERRGRLANGTIKSKRQRDV